MANGTTLSDVIVPELFNPYVINKTMELSALFQSGIITNNPEFDKLASEAAPVHNMPFFEDLHGDSEDILISIHVPRERDDSKNVAFCNKLTKAICANRSKEEL